MIGFELVRGVLSVTPETWGYLPFKRLLDRDDTEDKGDSLLEMLFIWQYASVGSDYEFLRDDGERELTIKRDIGLSKKWKIDKDMKAAIEFFKDRSQTALTELYDATVSSVNAISNYLNKTEELLNERDRYNKPITKLSDVTAALKSVKVIMRDVKDAYKEVIKESKEIDDKRIGKQTFNTFEEGLDFEQ